VRCTLYPPHINVQSLTFLSSLTFCAATTSNITFEFEDSDIEGVTADSDGKTSTTTIAATVVGAAAFCALIGTVVIWYRKANLGRHSNERCSDRLKQQVVVDGSDGINKRKRRGRFLRRGSGFDGNRTDSTSGGLTTVASAMYPDTDTDNDDDDTSIALRTTTTGKVALEPVEECRSYEGDDNATDSNEDSELHGNRARSSLWNIRDDDDVEEDLEDVIRGVVPQAFRFGSTDRSSKNNCSSGFSRLRSTNDASDDDKDDDVEKEKDDDDVGGEEEHVPMRVVDLIKVFSPPGSYT